jgi:cobalt/nickel transport system permease protein
MHIPDGFLDTKTIVATSALALLGVGRALFALKTRMSPRKVPLMGLAAAFIFVAQMINFPVAGGTSGHLLGAVLVAVLLGPNEAILVMSVVLVVQCFLFADGGVLALGANIFNMGLVATLAGYSLYRLLALLFRGERGKFAAASFAAWFSTVLAAVCCTGELAWSGTVPWSVAFPAMTGIHILIGIGEALITTLVLAAIYATRPDLLSLGREPRDGERKARPLAGVLIYGSLVIVGLILFVLPFASRWPDGLERVASVFGFSSRTLAARALSSPLADYRVPGIGSLSWATALAGIIGAALVFAVSFILAKAVLAKPRNHAP